MVGCTFHGLLFGFQDHLLSPSPIVNATDCDWHNHTNPTILPTPTPPTPQKNKPQRMREMSVRRKLNAMPAVFEGRSVLLIDDSIVRGTTMAQIVDMVRRAGARKVRRRLVAVGT